MPNVNKWTGNGSYTTKATQSGAVADQK